MIDMKLFISTEIFVLDCKPDYLYYDYLLFQSNLKCTFSGKSIMLYYVMFNFTLFASMHSIILTFYSVHFVSQSQLWSMGFGLFG